MTLILGKQHRMLEYIGHQSFLSIYIYCVNLIAEYYVHGCLRWRKARTYVYGDYNSTYEELLTKANLPALHIRRMRNMAIETFKILTELAPPVLSDLLVKKETGYNFRYSTILQVPQ